MPNYRRVFIPGGCYFFTVNLLDRNSRLLVENIDGLRDAVRLTRHRFPFEIDAMVVLPDHIHAVWTLPEGDADFSVRWRWIKIRFSRSIPNNEPRSAVREARGERGIWQRRYWEHLIRDERDFSNHIDYCWFNPVKHGHVTNVEDWPYSTFHRDHRDVSKPSDFEKKCAAYALANVDARFGERS
jgi:putative transposase